MSVALLLKEGPKTLVEYGHEFDRSITPSSANLSIADYMELAMKADSFSAIHRLCLMIKQRYGFNFFGFGLLTPTLNQGTVLSYVFDHHSKWNQHYKKNRYMAVDPFALYAVEHNAPLTWRASDRDQHFVPESRKMVNDAMDFGMKNLVQIPWHGKRGSAGGIRFSNFGDYSASINDIQHFMPELHYLSAFLLESVTRIVEKTSGFNEKVRLSTRETEILKWAACGKEANTIADILQISETTVLTHFKNIYIKLDVRTRQHAIARALSLSLIYI